MELNRANTGRIIRLDGLRGIAAFIVIISHLVTGFFPELYFGSSSQQERSIQDFVARSPLFVLYSGTFAVHVFFVLSGFVIASSASKTKCNIWMLIATRYVRLTIPIAVSVCIAFFMTKVLPGAPQRAARLVGSWWLDVLYQPVELSFSFALKEAAYKAYFSGISYYNNALWTMRTELIGSVGIYTLYAIFPKHTRKSILLITSALLIIATQELATNLLGFSVGALFSEWWREGKVSQLTLPGVLFCTAGILLGGLPFAHSHGTMYDIIFLFINNNNNTAIMLRTAGASLLVLGVMMWHCCGSYFETRIPQFLGRISFSLYLVHIPILCIGVSELYLLYGHSSIFSLVLIIICYFITTTTVAYCMTIFVDEPTVHILSIARNAKYIDIKNYFRSYINM